MDHLDRFNDWCFRKLESIRPRTWVLLLLALYTLNWAILFEII